MPREPTATGPLSSTERLLRLLRQAAGGLRVSAPAVDVAFLPAASTIYYASLARKAGDPCSAITELVQGIHESLPGEWRRLLRRRIYATGEPTDMCRGMLTVAAKRLTSGLEPSLDPGPGLDARFQQVSFITKARNRAEPAEGPDLSSLSDEGRLELARRQVTRQGDPAPLYLRDRPIGAVLVSREGRLLAATANRGGTNRTLHAEVLLIQGYWLRTRAPLPRGATLYTTLKPCRMCSGMIRVAAEDLEDFRVVYAEDDPGPNARFTALDGWSGLSQLSSRACGRRTR